MTKSIKTIAYAKERADATKKKYLVSNMGHVMADLTPNRSIIENICGGIHLTVFPKNGGAKP